jgi:hypothetical protein
MRRRFFFLLLFIILLQFRIKTFFLRANDNIQNISIFHINLAKTFNKGDEVAAGKFLGTHIGGQTTSDIAVGVNTPSGWKLISFFQAMEESLFNEYKKRGVNSIDNLIITKEERDAEPLTCKDDESFENSETLGNYVILK